MLWTDTRKAERDPKTGEAPLRGCCIVDVVSLNGMVLLHSRLTLLEPKVRGKGLVQQVGTRFWFWLSLYNPWVPTYWFEVCPNYQSFMFCRAVFPMVFPAVNGHLPEEIKPTIAKAVAKIYGPDRWNEAWECVQRSKLDLPALKVPRELHNKSAAVRWYEERAGKQEERMVTLVAPLHTRAVVLGVLADLRNGRNPFRLAAGILRPW